MRALVFAFALGVVVAGCRQNDDPEGARRLFAKVNEGPGFRAWRRPPGFGKRKPSFTAHMDAVEIFVNEPMASAIDTTGAQPREWPLGSIIVKEGYSGEDRELVAIMEKRPDGWYWAEFDGDGEPLYSGKPKICLECHDNRQSYSDWVYSVELPR